MELENYGGRISGAGMVVQKWREHANGYISELDKLIAVRDILDKLIQEKERKGVK